MLECNGFRNFHFIIAIVSLINLTPHIKSDDIILRPPHNGSARAIIFIQGAEIAASKYITLWKTVQNNAESAIWVGIPEFAFDTPNPVQIASKIARIKAEIAKQVKVDKYIYAGHSLGGYVLSQFLKTNPNDTETQILLGSFLTRNHNTLSWPEGLNGMDYPVHTLTIGGELDGLCRLTRIAEAYYRQQDHLADANTADKFPVIVLQGINHAQYIDGEPSGHVKANDLPSEVTKEEGFEIISQVINEYVENYLRPSNSDLLTQLRQETGDLLSPIITAFKMEGYYNFKPPCYNKTLVNAKINTCGHGAPWSSMAQNIMAGLKKTGLNNVTINNDDNFHRMYTVTPVHLPQVNNACVNTMPCTLNSVTVSENYYERLDTAVDTGFYPESAYEIKCKMSSRQRFWEKAGMKNVDFNKTDLGDICKDINQASLDYGISLTPKRNLDRYNRLGTPYVMGTDLGPFNEGPKWIWRYLNYTLITNPDTNKRIMLVRSPMIRTPTNYPISSASGFHDCKLLSPARVLEYVYVDSLRATPPTVGIGTNLVQELSL